MRSITLIEVNNLNDFGVVIGSKSGFSQHDISSV